MDPAGHEKPDAYNDKSQKSSSGLTHYLSSIPDNFDMYGNDLANAANQTTTSTNENSKVLQTFDNTYGINHGTDAHQPAGTSTTDNQGVLHHVFNGPIPGYGLAQSDPTSPTVVSQLVTADRPRYQSEPPKQEGPNNPEQHATPESHLLAPIARSLSTSALDSTRSVLPNNQSTFHGPFSTFPPNKLLNKPTTPSPLTRHMTTVAEGFQTPRVRSSFTVFSPTINSVQPVSDSVSVSGDRRFQLANSSAFLGYPVHGIGQAGSGEIKNEPFNAAHFNGISPGTKIREDVHYQEHSRVQNSYDFFDPPVYGHLRAGRSYDNDLLPNQHSENLAVGLHTQNYGAQLEYTRSNRALAQNAEGSLMRSQEDVPFSTTQHTHPDYYDEQIHHQQSSNFAPDVVPASPHSAQNSEQAITNTGNSVNYGQFNQRNLYGEAIRTPGVGFENTFLHANSVPYYLPVGSYEDPVLKFYCLYDFENKQGEIEYDEWWRADSTYPHLPAQEQSYVKEIIKAMVNMHSANDNPGMLDMWNKLKKNEDSLEITAWRLLAEKTICKHLLSADYTESFVDDPASAAHRVNNNRKVNGGKKAAIEKGRAAMSMVKDARDSDDVDREQSVMKDEYDQPIQGHSRQASQKVTNNGPIQGPMIQPELPADHGISTTQQEANVISTTPRTQEPSSKKPTKKGSATKKAAVKSSRRRSTRGSKGNVKDEDEDSDDDSYEPLKTPKRKRTTRATKYPTTQLADGSYVIKTVPSPTTTGPSRRKRQTTLEASATNQHMAAPDRTLSSFGEANQHGRTNMTSSGQGTLGNSSVSTASGFGQLGGTEPHPFTFGYQSQNPAYQTQTQGTHNFNPYATPSAAYQQILHESRARQGNSFGQDSVDPGLQGFSFLSPQEDPHDWT
ncbi:hypothetical protein MMC18_004398 [Xylographa bjoerkii]|nr:hypothetical protein [Xylographa bjoerkii]